MGVKHPYSPPIAIPGLLAGSALLTGAAAQAGEPATVLAAITITATRYPTQLESVPGQVEVLTAEDLRKRRSERLSDAINALPGMFVQGGRGLTQPVQSMAMRGIPDERRIQVLLDGVPLNDGYLGGLNFGGLSADNIDRVEALYGPASSLYGGNAMGGVVSYTTRMPTRTEFSVRAGYGNPFEAGQAPEHVRKLSLSAGTKLDNGLAVLAGGHWLDTSGYRTELVTSATAPTAGFAGWSLMSSKTGTGSYLLGNKGRTEWDEDGEFLKLEQRLAGGSVWRFGWHRQAYSYNSADPQTYLRNPAGVPAWGYGAGVTAVKENSFLNGAGGYERNLYQIGYDTEVLDGLLKVSAAYSDLSGMFSISPLSTPTAATRAGGSGRLNDAQAQSAFFDAYWNRLLGPHGLTLGLAWRDDQARVEDHNLANWTDPASKNGRNAMAAGKTATTGIYIQDEWRLAPDLTAHLGLRHDHWRNTDGSTQAPAAASITPYPARTDSAWSPKLALHYSVTPDFALRTSLGSAFRAPSVFELYRTTRVTYTIAANPNLKPETVETWDIGADLKPWSGGEFKLTFFANRMHDLIYVQGSGATRNRINAELAESQGAVLSFSQQLTTASRLLASYTYTDSEVKRNSPAPASVGKQLTNLPKHQATLGGDARIGDWTLAMTARYASKQFSSDDNTDVATAVYQAYDAYVVADAKVSYRIDRHFTASLAVDNLFDREYFSFYPAPRRNWFAELSYKY